MLDGELVQLHETVVPLRCGADIEVLVGGAVGDEVEGLAPGDFVIVPMYNSCGECANCKAGFTANCLERSFYGVETSHLIDVYQRWGLGAFGQTDLDSRVHRNQPTEALGRMSFGILQTFISRLESLHILSDLPELSNVMRQFQSRDNVYEQLEFPLQEVERPPMYTINAYQKKFGRHP